MRNDRNKVINKLYAKENKILSKTEKPNPIKQQIAEKVPEKLTETLNLAFEKAFKLIFKNGTGIIEKTINKEKVQTEHDVLKYAAERLPSKKNINRMDSLSRKSNLINNTITTLSGVGMGLLGIGLPDIPIFTATLLKGIYETALSYGFDYNKTSEQVYILRIIRTALSDNQDKIMNNSILNSRCYSDFDEEIALTSKTLADAMLVEKFVQGIPIVGAIGGISNNIIYSKVLKFAKIKYKQRYLE